MGLYSLVQTSPKLNSQGLPKVFDVTWVICNYRLGTPELLEASCKILLAIAFGNSFACDWDN